MLAEGRRGQCAGVEGAPGVGGGGVGLGKGVTDTLAGEPTVLVAEHEHVEAGSGGVVEEVICGVGDVSRGRHEECGGRSERDDGVKWAERQSKNRRGVVSSERGNAAVLVEAVPLHEVLGNGTHAPSPVFSNAS